MRLHVAGAPGPARVRAAQGRPKAEVGMVAGERFEIVAIVDGVLVANAEQKRELRRVGMRKIAGRHGAEGGNAGAGGDEKHVLSWVAHHEKAEGRGNLDR